MALPTFVPGYLGTVTINAEDQSITLHVVSLDTSRDTPVKKTMGQPEAFHISGQDVTTFAANGSVTAEKHAALEAAFALRTAVVCSIQLGEAAGATDAGLYSGSFRISQRRVEGNAEGQWTWSLQAMATGPVAYTPAGS